MEVRRLVVIISDLLLRSQGSIYTTEILNGSLWLESRWNTAPKPCKSQQEGLGSSTGNLAEL